LPLTFKSGAVARGWRGIFENRNLDAQRIGYRETAIVVTVLIDDYRQVICVFSATTVIVCDAGATEGCKKALAVK
jgi:hypothetical protein